MRIKLSGIHNKYTYIDKKYYLVIPELQESWHMSPSGYARRSIYIDGKVKSQYMARLIWERIYNRNVPKDMEVEHRDRNKLNNTRKNLRLCTVSENHRNIVKLRGRSRYKGVSYHKHTKLWQTSGSLNGKKIFLGYYKGQKEAARAYDRFAKQNFRKFSVLNNV